MNAEKSSGNLADRKFGRLTAIEMTVRNRQGQWRWLCICDCGKKCEIDGKSLREGHTKSCGCFRRDETSRRRIKPKGEAAARCLFLNYGYGAQKRKISFNLSFDEFVSIIGQNCAYCGVPPSQSYQKKYTSSVVYNGIDRKDVAIGYVKNNCVPCCGRCNIAKGSMDESEFLSMIKEVYLYRHLESEEFSSTRRKSYAVCKMGHRNNENK